MIEKTARYKIAIEITFHRGTPNSSNLGYERKFSNLPRGFLSLRGKKGERKSARRMAKKQGRVDVTGKPRRKKGTSAGHEVRLERLFMCRHVSASSEGKQKGVGRYG